MNFDDLTNVTEIELSKVDNDNNSSNSISEMNELEEDKALAYVNNYEKYKLELRKSPEVKQLLNEINIKDPNSVLSFGAKPSQELAKVSDNLLSNLKDVSKTEQLRMFETLNDIMDRFDVKEFEDLKDFDKPVKKRNFLSKFFHKGKLLTQETVEKIFDKYNNMGNEIQKVYTILKSYEDQLKENNRGLNIMQDTNVDHFKALEKYIVAGELAEEQLDAKIKEIEADTSLSEVERTNILTKATEIKDLLSQRVYDMRISENIALQSIPMIAMTKRSNYMLARKINSAFTTTLPIFKQGIVQAIQLKRQRIIAQSMSEFDKRADELVRKNTENTVNQALMTAKLAGTSSISVETLNESYEKIKAGIEESKRIVEENRRKRDEGTKKLEEIKVKIKQNDLGSV